ncbi:MULTISPECIES: sugar ABC transporter permease [Microbulbifer]|uniref:Maltose/maltodextrin transport system permease protein MalG n=1 Tax=Microbulbifer celer TaxID=435905 RepID=A0ABW3U9J5_9GAMM|nr:MULTISPECIES: sugar ABC transporter permease [Microbulbifer]UFN56502.1 sugar ABC transporter permease [Microbulbifer celer]
MSDRAMNHNALAGAVTPYRERAIARGTAVLRDVFSWRFALLLFASAVVIYPLLWVVGLAFSGQQALILVQLPEDAGILDQLLALMPLPTQWSLSNFSAVLTEQPFLRWLGNSLVIALSTTLVGLSLSCSAAYAFSRFRFAGRERGLMLFLVSQMFPSVLMLIPLYVIVVQWLGLGNSWLGLILVYSITALPFCVWMLKGYFDTLPYEIEEAALLEGASRLTIFIRIVLPQARPAIAVTGLFAFMTAWNEFILAAIFMDDDSRYTVPVGLRFFVSDYASEWGYFAAGSILVSLPVMLLFLALQRFLVSGLSGGAVKG